MSKKRRSMGLDDALDDFEPAKDVVRPSPEEIAKTAEIGKAHGYVGRDEPEEGKPMVPKRVVYRSSLTIKVLQDDAQWFRVTSNQNGIVGGKMFEQMKIAWLEKYGEEKS